MPITHRELQNALQETAEIHGPGLFGLVTEGGEVVFEGSAGAADVAQSRPIVAEDRFRVGSVTKIYVAVLLLQLMDEGVLAFDDTVERWLPGLVPGGETITVELLARMRSGLPDYVAALFGDPPDIGVLARYWAPEDLVGIALDSPGRYVAGSGYRYCSTDYVLLGLIIEAATGQRVEAQLWQRIFAPLGLEQTSFPSVDPILRGQHASGYVRPDPGSAYFECTTATPSESWTSGAVVSTPRDVGTFLDGLLDGKLLPPATLASMLDCSEVIDDGVARGLGIVRYTFDSGAIAYGHQGGLAGFTTMALRTTTGRCVILYQNALDLYAPLNYTAKFVELAVQP